MDETKEAFRVLSQVGVLSVECGKWRVLAEEREKELSWLRSRYDALLARLPKEEGNAE